MAVQAASGREMEMVFPEAVAAAMAREAAGAAMAGAGMQSPFWLST